MRTTNISYLLLKPLSIFYPSRLKLIFIALILLGASLFFSYRETISHVTRPLWDAPPKQWKYITNYDVGERESCRFYGFHPRPKDKEVRIIDTFLFNNELDWLEIRLNELDSVVDFFIVVESTRTFTNQPKELVLRNTLQYEKNNFINVKHSRFLKFAHKLILVTLNEASSPNRSAFSRESYLRGMIGSKGFTKIPNGIRNGDIVIIADIDEVPRPTVLQLLKNCVGWPNPVHIETRRYLYSFEFPMGTTDATSIWSYKSTEPFSTGRRKIGDTIIADAGWHCSFCFKYLDEFINKMNSYSHFDRAKPEFQDPEAIQRRICSGIDLYDRHPMEAYNFKDVVKSYGSIPPQKSAVSLPSYVLKHHDRFSYLLPGFCKRPRLGS